MDRSAANRSSHAHGAEIAKMTRDRGWQDRNDAEPLAERQGRQDAALGNAQDGPRTLLAQCMHARVGEAGYDEGRCLALERRRLLQERSDDAVHVTLGLDTRRAFKQGHAGDRGTIGGTERRNSCVDARRYAFVGIGIDDVDRSAHGSPSSLLARTACCCARHVS